MQAPHRPTLTIGPGVSPANIQGAICNYDTSQYGESPGNRRQGQLQINLVVPVFTTLTMGVTECTFIQGHSYRITFQGVGQVYTCAAYDLNDLTTPVAGFSVYDYTTSFTHGVCGFTGFERSSGNVDITFDNYVEGPTDPNLATPPAINHPIPGTPVVSTRSPANRYQNFLGIPSAGISFTANTYSANVINAAATKLRLNGVDVSAGLTLPANGTSITCSYPGSALDTNQLYSAQIEVTDVAGVLSSTNTFWFDTFSDAYLLAAAVKTIEAEEYNYGGGLHIAEPIPPSGTNVTTLAPVNAFPTGYYAAAAATPGIDYSSSRNGAAPGGGSPDLWSELRTLDPVATGYGAIGLYYDSPPAGTPVNPNETDPGSDNVRSEYAALGLLEGTVDHENTGDWQNYTRSFSGAFYRAYLRYSSFGATTNELDLVTSDPTLTGQTTAKLGTFKIPNNQRWINYLYTPLVSDAGAPILLNLSGVNTLRLTSVGPGEDQNKAMANYIMLVQTPVSVYSCATVNGTYTLEGSATPNYANRTISVPQSGGTRFYRLSAAIPLTIQSVSVSGGNVILSL